MSWFGNKSMKGAGLLYKFTHIENRLVRWLLEKHGFKSTAPDYSANPPDYDNVNASNCNFLANNAVALIWSSQTVKSNIYQNLGRF